VIGGLTLLDTWQSKDAPKGFKEKNEDVRELTQFCLTTFMGISDTDTN
jgi:hypothetical protein